MSAGAPPPDEAGAGWGALALFFAANVLFGAGLFAHAFLYNFYLDGLGFDEGVMGLAAAALTGGGLVALGPAGVAVDRLGTRLSYLLAVAVGSAGLVAGAVATSPAAIYGAAAVAGAGTATWRVSMGPIVMRLTSLRTRARAFSWNVALLVGSGAAWTAASGAIPARAERLLGLGPVGGIRAVLVLGALGTAASALVFLWISRTHFHRPGPAPGGVARAGRAAGAGGAVGPGGARPVATEAAAAPGEDSTGSGPGGVVGVLAGLRIPLSLAVLVVLVAVWMSAAGLVLPFFNLYFLRVHDLELSRIGAILAAAQAVSAVAVFGSGELAARLGTRRTLAFWILLFAPGLWALAVVEPLAAAVGLYLFQAVIAPATNPLIDQILLERAPEERQGAVSSWRNGATELSGLVGASGGGFLLRAAGFGGLFAVAGAAGLAGGSALLLALRHQSSARDRLMATRPRSSR